jgi:glycosyltransferase involved in cell wall biosynthesis
MKTECVERIGALITVHAAKVSIVITSYNHASFIGEAIESVLAQTHAPFEVVVVDDASQDASLDVIGRYSDSITLIANPHNLGGAKTTSIGIDACSGDYIAVLNSDDVWEPDKLAKQIQFMTTNNLDACFTHVTVIDEDSRTVSPAPPEYDKFDRDAPEFDSFLVHFFCFGNFLCHSSVLATADLYRKSGAYKNVLRQLPDFDKWVAFARLGKIGILAEPLVRYRTLGSGNTSSSQSSEAFMRTRFEHFAIFLDFFDGIPIETVKTLFAAVVPIDVTEKDRERLIADILYAHPSPSLREPAQLAAMVGLVQHSVSAETDHRLHEMTGSTDVFHLIPPIVERRTLAQRILGRLSR